MKTAALRRLRRALTTGNIWLHILSMLKQKPTYAYVLEEQMKRHSGFAHGLIMNYVVLYKMEGEGLISSYHEGRRKYYEITAKGRKALAEAKKYLVTVSSKL